MTRIALLAALLSYATACGDRYACDCDPDEQPRPDGAPPYPPCDLVGQAGCAAGEKCAIVIEDREPFLLSRIGCVLDGSVAVGGSCVIGEPPLGWDDCLAGLHCYDGTCAELCAVGDGGCLDGICVGVQHDKALLAAAVCVPSCDPFAQDCDQATRSCYLDPLEASGACLVPHAAGGLPGQDELCQRCSHNACAPGHAPLLPEMPDDDRSSVCAFVCTPSETEPGGDPGGTPCSFESAELPSGPGGVFECRFINSLIQGAEDVPPQFGLCVDPAVWGACADNTGDRETDTPGCEPR